MMATQIVKLMMTKTFLTWKRFLRKRRKNLRLKVNRLKKVGKWNRRKSSRNLTKMKVKSLKKTTRISSKKR